MARPKSKGAYVPLAAQYYLDDAILEAGPDAELLFLRCISFLASVSTDGFITERQVRVAGTGLRNVARRLQVLERTGLLAAQDGGFVARSWTKWNKSAEQIGKELARDRERKRAKGSSTHEDAQRSTLEDSSRTALHIARQSLHSAAHSETFAVDERESLLGSEPSNSGENAHNSARNPDGFHPDSSPQSSTEQSSTEQSNSSLSDADASDPEFSADVIRLCDLLAELIRLNGNKVGKVGKGWWLACDRLMRLDGYTPQQVEWVMRWSQQNEFWQSNILSMPKLREKFDQLKTRAMNERNERKLTRTEQNLAVVAQYAAMESQQGEINA